MLAPVLHAVAGVIVSDDLLVGVIILADDGHFLHIKPRLLQFLHCFLCLSVGWVNGYNRVRFRHSFCSFHSADLIYRDASIVQRVFPGKFHARELFVPVMNRYGSLGCFISV